MSAILGKDLTAFMLNDELLHFTVLFSTDHLEIEGQSYQHGELVTDFLNCDVTELAEMLKLLRYMAEDKNEHAYNGLERKMIDSIFALPLFRDFEYRRQWLQRKKSPDPYVNLSDYAKIVEDLRALERYRWFLREVFRRTTWKVDTNKFAFLIENNGMSAFTRGISLGESMDADPVRIAVQYEINESTDGKIQLFEKTQFTRLIDFFYVDLFKAIMQDYCPKPCKLCGRFFLQDDGMAYEYCENIAPDESERTCRQIGSDRSFKEKIKNNPVWQIHQRAYKKYHRRKQKQTMSATELAEWAIMAENLRDEWLLWYSRNNEIDLSAYTDKLNSIR